MAQAMPQGGLRSSPKFPSVSAITLANLERSISLAYTYGSPDLSDIQGTSEVAAAIAYASTSGKRTSARREVAVARESCAACNPRGATPGERSDAAAAAP